MKHKFIASYYTLAGADFGSRARVSLKDRCAAASVAGFQGLGMHHNELSLGDDFLVEARRHLDKFSLKVVELEQLSGFCSVDPIDVARLWRDEQRIHRLASALGGGYMSVGDLNSFSGVDRTIMVSRLQQIARRASDFDLFVGLESFPWSTIPSFSDASRVIDLVGEPNFGHLIDSWHYFNGGSSVGELAGLPVEQIVGVQLNDGRRVSKRYKHEARTARMFPGEGDLPVVDLVGQLAAIGFDGPWAIEVNPYQSYGETNVDSIASRAMESIRSVFEAAGLL